MSIIILNDRACKTSLELQQPVNPIRNLITKECKTSLNTVNELEKNNVTLVFNGKST